MHENLEDPAQEEGQSLVCKGFEPILRQVMYTPTSDRSLLMPSGTYNHTLQGEEEAADNNHGHEETIGDGLAAAGGGHGQRNRA